LEKTLGPGHPDVVEMLERLSGCYRKQEKRDEEQLYGVFQSDCAPYRSLATW